MTFHHLISTENLSKESAIAILDTATRMSSLKQKCDILSNQTVANLFLENSTRTKISFEIAAKNLSANIINFATSTSSVSKGESIVDTVETLQAMGTNIVVIRDSFPGSPQMLVDSSTISAAIINAGDGMNQHPTQALLDAFTIRKYLAKISKNTLPTYSDLSGISIAIVGDILHSRVARSNIFLLKTLGAKVILVAPETLLPTDTNRWGVEISYDLRSVVAQKPDVIMMLRIQKERMQDSYFPTENEYRKFWSLNSVDIKKYLSSKTLILHPGPVNRGLEISSNILNSSQSKILDQVSNGIFVRMAVLETVGKNYSQEHSV